MAAPVPKPFELSEDDMADRTVELDMRWLHESPEAPAKIIDTTSIYDEPTVVLDLTPKQVDALLNKKK